MDGAIIFLVLVAILFLAVLPLVALGLAIAAGNRARRNEAQLQLMDENLQAFNVAIAAINRKLSNASESVSASAAQPVGGGFQGRSWRWIPGSWIPGSVLKS
jgi:hypothetical protein